jgi:hypothetical protein
MRLREKAGNNEFNDIETVIGQRFLCGVNREISVYMGLYPVPRPSFFSQLAGKEK